MKPEALLAEIEPLIALAAKREDLDGDARRKWVTDATVDRLDDLLEWGPGPVGALAELADGPVLRALRSLVEVAVQHGYERHKAKRAAKAADAPVEPPPDEEPKRRSKKSER